MTAERLRDGIMRRCQMVLLASILLVAAGVVSCGKKVASDASAPLEESFQQAEPETQQAIEEVTSNLRARNYSQAMRHLAPVIENRQLTEAQKQAVTTMLQQVNDAIVADPSLETAEMYRMRQNMFHSVYGKSGRF